MSRLLIIDDEPHFANMLREAFESQGYEVFVAHDGNEGIRRCREHSPDAVITDIVMPEKEGLEMIAEVRRDFPDMIIVAMTGVSVGAEDYLKMARLQGAKLMYQKPFPIRKMVDEVRELIAP